MRHRFASRPRLRSALAVLVALLTAGTVNAQGTRQSTIVIGDTVPAGTFRGTLVVREIADHRSEPLRPISGAASWRFELDTVDWRRKLTLRVTLSGTEGTVISLRTASADVPPRGLTVKNNAHSHIDPRYYTATMSLRENERQRIYSHWIVGEDSVLFAPVDSLSPTVVLRGRLHLQGFHDSAIHPGHGYDIPQTGRYVEGVFAATFDPQPEPVQTMGREMQTRIMERALWDFANNWGAGRVNPSGADSTKDNVKARAFLTHRWSEAAIVDSVAVAERSFYVSMHGRHVPVTCLFTSRQMRPTCVDALR